MILNPIVHTKDNVWHISTPWISTSDFVLKNGLQEKLFLIARLENTDTVIFRGRFYPVDSLQKKLYLVLRFSIKDSILNRYQYPDDRLDQDSLYTAYLKSLPSLSPEDMKRLARDSAKVVHKYLRKQKLKNFFKTNK